MIQREVHMSSKRQWQQIKTTTFIQCSYVLQIKYYALGKRILLCDMPGFEREEQKSIPLEHVVKILEGKVQDRADVNILNYNYYVIDDRILPITPIVNICIIECVTYMISR